MAARMRRGSRDESHEAVKQAVREVIDETLVSFANGANQFASDVTKSLSAISDSFDEFFTRNLRDNSAPTADAFIDARLKAMKDTQRLVEKKISQLERSRRQHHGKHQR